MESRVDITCVTGLHWESGNHDSPTIEALPPRQASGESANIVPKEGVGIVFEPENAGQLDEHLKFLQRDHDAYAGYRAQCLVAAKNYDRTAMAMKMLGVVSQFGQ